MPRLQPHTSAHDDALEHHRERVRHLRAALADDTDPHLLHETRRELAYHARILSALRAEGR